MTLPNVLTLLAAAQLAVMIGIDEGAHALGATVCEPAIAFTYGTYTFEQVKTNMVRLYAALLILSYVHDVLWGAFMGGVTWYWKYSTWKATILSMTTFILQFNMLVVSCISIAVMNRNQGGDIVRALTPSAIQTLAANNMTYLDDVTLGLFNAGNDAGNLGIHVMFNGTNPACAQQCPHVLNAALPCWLPAHTQTMSTLQDALLNKHDLAHYITVLNALYLVALVIMTWIFVSTYARWCKTSMDGPQEKHNKTSAPFASMPPATTAPPPASPLTLSFA